MNLLSDSLFTITLQYPKQVEELKLFMQTLNLPDHLRLELDRFYSWLETSKACEPAVARLPVIELQLCKGKVENLWHVQHITTDAIFGKPLRLLGTFTVYNKPRKQRRAREVSYSLKLDVHQIKSIVAELFGSVLNNEAHTPVPEYNFVANRNKLCQWLGGKPWALRRKMRACWDLNTDGWHSYSRDEEIDRRVLTVIKEVVSLEILGVTRLVAKSFGEPTTPQSHTDQFNWLDEFVNQCFFCSDSEADITWQDLPWVVKQFVITRFHKFDTLYAPYTKEPILFPMGFHSALKEARLAFWEDHLNNIKTFVSVIDKKLGVVREPAVKSKVPQPSPQPKREQVSRGKAWRRYAASILFQVDPSQTTATQRLMVAQHNEQVFVRKLPRATALLIAVRQHTKCDESDDFLLQHIATSFMQADARVCIDIHNAGYPSEYPQVVGSNVSDNFVNTVAEKLYGKDHIQFKGMRLAIRQYLEGQGGSLFNRVRATLPNPTTSQVLERIITAFKQAVMDTTQLKTRQLPANQVHDRLHSLLLSLYSANKCRRLGFIGNYRPSNSSLVNESLKFLGIQYVQDLTVAQHNEYIGNKLTPLCVLTDKTFELLKRKARLQVRSYQLSVREDWLSSRIQSLHGKKDKL